MTGAENCGSDAKHEQLAGRDVGHEHLDEHLADRELGEHPRPSTKVLECFRLMSDLVFLAELGEPLAITVM